jgi:hypothetical protein
MLLKKQVFSGFDELARLWKVKELHFHLAVIDPRISVLIIRSVRAAVSLDGAHV